MSAATGVPLPADDAAPEEKPRPKAVPPEALPSAVIDNHTHLDAVGCVTADDVASVMERAAAVGVQSVITIADDLASARWVAQAAMWHENVYAAVALHPTRADVLDDEAREALTELAFQERVVAIGETGLDYYWDAAPHAVQREAFAWHIDLAKKTGKPLMIHDRNAHDDVLDILRVEGAPETVVFHCYSGDAAMAKVCVDRGYLLSFAGPVSFKNSRDLHEAVTAIPVEHILVETDAPFLTPHPERGKRNEPYALPYTVRAIAKLRETDLETLCDAVMVTTQATYRIR